MSSFKNFVLWLYGSLGNIPSIFSCFTSTETSITACVALASPLFMHITIRRYARILHPSVFFMSSTKEERLKISTNLFFILIKTKFDLFYFLFINMDNILSPNGDTRKPKFCLRGSVKLHRLPFENIKLCLFSCCVFFSPASPWYPSCIVLWITPTRLAILAFHLSHLLLLMQLQCTISSPLLYSSQLSSSIPVHQNSLSCVNGAQPNLLVSVWKLSTTSQQKLNEGWMSYILYLPSY